MSVNPAHRDHDEMLIVRVAAADADELDQRRAADQLGACEDCRALLADLGAIRSATVAGVLRIPRRPRSFRIDPAELQRLGAPAWRRWLRRVGTPSFDFIRPLATVVAGLGLAVAVLGSASPGATSIPLAGTAEGTEAPGVGGADQFTSGAPIPALGPASSPAATGRENSAGAAQATSGSSGAPSAYGDTTKGTTAPSNAAGAPNPAVTNPPTPAAAQTPSAPPLLPIGLAVLVIGLAALFFNTAARRAAGR
jgi:hypothetical protein